MKKGTIKEIQEAIIEDFRVFQELRGEMIAYIMEIGAKMERLDTKAKCAQNRIEGCLSSVWLVAKYKNGRLFLAGESEAMITNGILSLLLRVFSGQPVKDIVESKLFFPDAIGLDNLMSLQRRSGLQHIAKQILQLATDYNNIG